MNIFIDGDGCPVIEITINIAKKYNIDVIIVSDTSHIYNYEDVKILIVSKGADNADFLIVNKAVKDDIVITQDYGLAAMCLSKNIVAVNQNGFIYNNRNIDMMLLNRHISKKIRKSGGKTSNIKKRTSADNEKFKLCLIKLIENMLK